MDLGLKGRTVIVTGGSGGIGRHLVRRFEDEGADVISTHHATETVSRLTSVTTRPR